MSVGEERLGLLPFYAWSSGAESEALIPRALVGLELPLHSLGGEVEPGRCTPACSSTSRMHGSLTCNSSSKVMHHKPERVLYFLKYAFVPEMLFPYVKNINIVINWFN